MAIPRHAMNVPPVYAELEKRQASMQYTMRRMPLPNRNVPPIYTPEIIVSPVPFLIISYLAFVSRC
jgi:hypothetical protein